MIRIRKPTAPAELKKGVPKTARDCDEYMNGRRKFEFDERIYRHETVKRTLRDAQHGKCCYCEGRFEAFSSGDIEHYRPMNAVRQKMRSKRHFPGYYWLAYCWSNLFWSCPVCNRTCKNDLFPIENPGERARSHESSIDRERPLIVNPSGSEDPTLHIGFYDEVAVSDTDKGITTIRTIDLNRNDLREARRRHLTHVDMLLFITRNPGKFPESQVARATSELEESVEPSAEFSAMTAVFLDKQLRLDAAEQE